MNNDLSALEKSHELNGFFQQIYRRHKQNIANAREFIEVEDLICDQLLEQIHNYFIVQRLVLSTATLNLRSGEIYSLPDGTRYIALRNGADNYLLYAEEAGFRFPPGYEITAGGAV